MVLPIMALTILAVAVLAIVILGMTDPFELIILMGIAALMVGMYTGRI